MFHFHHKKMLRNRYLPGSDLIFSDLVDILLWVRKSVISFSKVSSPWVSNFIYIPQNIIITVRIPLFVLNRARYQNYSYIISRLLIVSGHSLPWASWWESPNQCLYMNNPCILLSSLLFHIFPLHTFLLHMTTLSI